MKIEIKEDKKNPLLDRREVRFTADSKLTPTRKEIKSTIAGILKTKEDLLVIDSIRQVSGKNLSEGYAKVYNNTDVLKKIELSYKLERGTKEKKKEETPAPSAEEAAPAPPTEEKPPEGEAPAPAGEEETPTEVEKPAEEAPAPAVEEEKPAEETPSEAPQEEEKKEEAEKEEPKPEVANNG